MQIKRTIPFSWRNKLLGLEGKSKEIAEAEYYFTGEELDRELAKIESSHAIETEDELARRFLKIDLKYDKITDEEFDRRHVDLTIKDETKRKLSHLQIDKDHGLVDELEFEKRLASINKAPWVKCDLIATDENPHNGYFDLDWNQYFIEGLIKNGYEGIDDEDIIQKWLMTIFRNEIQSGEIDPERVKVKAAARDDGRTEYS